ncbi:MAG: hypothetical protein LBS41_02965 [Streptococcaceae bacterium]|jgi:hypothetical protein|nr:hypothetical protein [Streptococcaceae bacterium]
MELAIMSYIVAVIGVVLILTPIVLGVFGLYALGTCIFGRGDDARSKEVQKRNAEFKKWYKDQQQSDAEWVKEMRVILDKYEIDKSTTELSK